MNSLTAARPSPALSAASPSNQLRVRLRFDLQLGRETRGQRLRLCGFPQRDIDLPRDESRLKGLAEFQCLLHCGERRRFLTSQDLHVGERPQLGGGGVPIGFASAHIVRYAFLENRDGFRKAALIHSEIGQTGRGIGRVGLLKLVVSFGCLRPSVPGAGTGVCLVEIAAVEAQLQRFRGLPGGALGIAAVSQVMARLAR